VFITSSSVLNSNKSSPHSAQFISGSQHGVSFAMLSLNRPDYHRLTLAVRENLKNALLEELL
jgi:hypothetical protein